VSLWRRIYVERRSVILPLFILLIGNVALLALAVLPLSGSVASLHGDALNATTAMLKARTIDQQAKDARGSKERADQELKKFYGEILPATPAGARKVMSFLERTADESGLKFQNSHVEESEIKDSRLERMSAKITLVGDYQNIRKYLYAIETAQQFVVVERVGLSQAADLRSSNSGRLEVTLDVATYFVAAGPAGALSQ
jgi:Tfp pilus assembly protein PilO